MESKKNVMWIFTYGSLMSGGWATKFGCVRYELAEMPNYCRVFNKASIKNWGTKAHPCPTVNLEPAESASCHGVAFSFLDDQRHNLLAYLAEREGKGFELQELRIQLAGGDEVRAIVPFYKGKNLISDKTAPQTASMVATAHGSSGSCIAYINSIVSKLAELGINDPVVSELQTAVEAQHGLDIL